METFCDLLISPLTFGLVLLVLVVLNWWRLGARGGRLLAAFALFSYTVVMVPAVPYALGRAFTWRYRPLLALERTADVIVLLGGGQMEINDLERDVPVLTPSSARRVLEAVRMYKLLGDPWVISSGGFGPPAPN